MELESHESSENRILTRTWFRFLLYAVRENWSIVRENRDCRIRVAHKNVEVFLMLTLYEKWRLLFFALKNAKFFKFCWRCFCMSAKCIGDIRLMATLHVEKSVEALRPSLFHKIWPSMTANINRSYACCSWIPPARALFCRPCPARKHFNFLLSFISPVTVAHQDANLLLLTI